jgi:hypothetical protein
MAKRARTALLGLLLVTFFVSTIQAQSEATTGVIEGSVLDPSGGALPGAAVAVRNTATNFEQTLTTVRDVSGPCLCRSVRTG